jgi:hypothetical protein
MLPPRWLLCTTSLNLSTPWLADPDRQWSWRPAVGWLRRAIIGSFAPADRPAIARRLQLPALDPAR